MNKYVFYTYADLNETQIADIENELGAMLNHTVSVTEDEYEPNPTQRVFERGEEI